MTLCKCGRESLPGRKMCQRCVDKDKRHRANPEAKARRKARQDARKDQGLCRCGKDVPAEGRQSCARCLQANVDFKLRHPGRAAIHAKAWREKNPEKVKASNAKRPKEQLRRIAKLHYRRKNPKRIALTPKELKYIVYSHYSGGDIQCKCCGEPTYEFLALDHIHNNGNRHRREVARYYGLTTKAAATTYVLKWIIEHNFPEEFQLLCCNCNWGKHVGKGICPHQRIKEAVA